MSAPVPVAVAFGKACWSEWRSARCAGASGVRQGVPERVAFGKACRSEWRSARRAGASGIRQGVLERTNLRASGWFVRWMQIFVRNRTIRRSRQRFVCPDTPRAHYEPQPALGSSAQSPRPRASGNHSTAAAIRMLNDPEPANPASTNRPARAAGTIRRAGRVRPGSRAVSSAGRAPALQAGSRRFEPVTAHSERSW